MAALAGTFRRGDAVVNRESLSDVVSRITPEDTPIYSMISHPKADATYEEWAVDALAAPAANVNEEGDEYTFDTTDPAVRVGNHTQILRKTYIISGSQEAGKNAGNTEKMREQKLKKGIEIRKDVEFSMLGAAASVAGNSRVSGSLSTWYETNASRGTTGTNGGFNQGTSLTVAPGNGTQRAFTKALLDDVMQQVYIAGGNARHASVSPYVKSVFVTFMSDANVAPFRYSVDDGDGNALISNADVYEGPHGKIMVHPNRVQATAALARNVHILDTEKLGWMWYRPIGNVKDLAKTGDAHKGVVLGEGTLKVANEASSGVVADVFGMTAST